ncbi:MerR family transcriptional regulator [Massilia sp. H6]|uniref:MerR family transcriptional regulator n=1 Tax=Massilia sp. H6 TaxID=2970464 RepID=UPI0021684C20|nr:MerR family transcriptional regulator [Massilia sp. H6]UVW30667.1 helix-turn-helix domain-containing protein [Massilia sp. H6]
MTPADSKEFSIDELCILTDLPKRTVRYYMQIGLVDRPDGETRAARYGQRHLEQLLSVRRWTHAGLSLERVRELLDQAGQPPTVPGNRAGTVEVWSHLVVAEGVEVRLNPTIARLSLEQTRRFFAAVMSAFEQIQQEDPPV